MKPKKIQILFGYPTVSFETKVVAPMNKAYWKKLKKRLNEICNPPEITLSNK